MRNLKQGILITIEGIDGCGKTTFLKKLTKMLENQVPLKITKEPGDTELGKHLRKLLQAQITSITPKAEYLLFAADRAQHICDIVRPALKQKKLVISDRMDDSSVVYQGYARDLGPQMINQINQWIMEQIKPDLIIFIKLSPMKAYLRIAKRNEELSAFEREKEEFMQKVADSYLVWLNKKNNVLTLDGTKSPDELAKEAYNYINNWFTKENIYDQ